MAALRPFRALRPAPGAARQVAAVPYDVVSTEEVRALAAGNPLSFLHVSRPEIDLPAGTDPYAPEVYAQASANLEALIPAAPLVVEDAPSLYLYRLRTPEHEQTGVAACFSLDEYDSGAIRKHERTRRDKEDDRTRHMLELRAQTGLVFLTYGASAEVAAATDRVRDGAPLYDFEAPDGVTHTVWRVEPAEAQDLTAAFERVPSLYIADGHHRAASAARARARLRAAGPQDGRRGAGDFNTFLAVAFPHDQVRILPYNRVVKDLGGRSPEALLAKVRERFRVAAAETDEGPERKGLAGMYLAGRWYTMELQPPEGDGARDAIAGLDVSVLQERLLAPVLGIADVRTDPRIDFVGGARGTKELERLVDGGRAAVAFAMYPVSVDDLMRVSDAGGIMPPKSTWFEPKLRDGLLVHLI